MVTVVNASPHHSVVKEAICKNCGATLSYVPADVKSDRHYDYTGDSDVVHTIKCPQCNHKIGVNK